MAKHRTMEATQAAVAGRAPRRRNLPKGNVWRKAMEMLASGKMRSPNHRMEAEKIAEAAKRAEKRNHARASALHEKAGDLFSKSWEAPVTLPGPTIFTFEQALPEQGDFASPRLMLSEAITQYESAARLARNPGRVKMLNGKADAVRREMEGAADY